MIRRATRLAVVVVCLSPVPAHAQAVVFKVSAASADVYKAPSTGSPIIGHAARGVTLDVTRELGSWVKVVWPRAEDRVGYVHVSAGSIAHAASAAAPHDTDGRIPPPPPSTRSTPPPAAPGPARAAKNAPVRQSYVRRPAHTLGVGGLAGGPDLSIGATARAWSSAHDRFGLQLEVSRVTFGDEPRRLTTFQVAPSVLYAFHDRVSDYWWLRPYVGAGPNLQHQSRGGLLPDDRDPLAETRLGVQAFAGAEVTFASLPQLAVSADAGYRGHPTSFAGLEPSGFGVVISAHWYLR